MVAFSRSAQGGRERRVLRALVLWGGLLTAVAAAVLFVAAPTLIPMVYGDEFNDSVPLVRILVFGGAAVSIGQILAGILRGRGKPGSVAIAEAAGAAATVLGILVLGTDRIEYVAYSAITGFILTVALESAVLVRGGPIGAPRDP
jgi:O-antigen/teichoic acid export membrane protein